MANSLATEITGPQPPAANFFAVPGSSERARTADKGMRCANRQFAQRAVFSVAYGDAQKNAAGLKGAYSLHLAESSLVVRRTKSMAARLRDVGKLDFKPKPERFSDI
ncbi:MAG: hypothetical protein ACHQIK_00815 [Candidatus Acidiferrales bacterium]